MSAATNYLENKLLDHFLGQGTRDYTSPTLYLALATAVSDVEAGTFTEVTTSGTAYARQTFTMAAASGGSSSSDANIQFPTATANYGADVVAIAIMDASTGGNALVIQNLASAKTVESGDTFVVNTGNLTVNLD